MTEEGAVNGAAKNGSPRAYVGEKGAGEHVARGLRIDLADVLHVSHDLTWNELMNKVYDLRNSREP